jgi:hypothetical protein
MKPLMILVILAAAGGAAWFAVSQKGASEPKVQGGDTTQGVAYINPNLKNEGVPPTGEPEWDVQVQLNRVGAGQQHRFTFKVTEKHGWAANGIYIAFWHRTKDPNTGEWVKDSRETSVLLSNDYLHFNKPLEFSTTVAKHELIELKDFGTTENWEAKVTNFSDLTAPKP